jgi:hypothetical protein
MLTQPFRDDDRNYALGDDGTPNDKVLPHRDAGQCPQGRMAHDTHEFYVSA